MADKGPDKGFVARVKFEKRSDGRFHIHSPEIPGLHLAGRDLAKIRADLEILVRDLLYFNQNIVVDALSWVPSLEDTFKKAEAAPIPKPNKPSFFVIVGHERHAA
jgi:hypothetical protein